jgi:hypothetical protein
MQQAFDVSIQGMRHVSLGLVLVIHKPADKLAGTFVERVIYDQVDIVVT